MSLARVETYCTINGVYSDVFQKILHIKDAHCQHFDLKPKHLTGCSCFMAIIYYSLNVGFSSMLISLA